ncbi:MAG: hypothetical protein MI757_03325 [Pirellulales bacterium]|nr:hypothetical protein [Pirellulales bacterium]
MSCAANARKTKRLTTSQAKPSLRFTPTAWAKLLFLRDLGSTEVGGFGIASAEDSLLVEDFVLVRQTCTSVTVVFNDEAVADFFDTQVDAGRAPESFFRVWCHTHPGNSARPSSVDEATFTRVFGPCDWSVMFILACEGQRYARLRFNVGPGGELEIPVEVDYSNPFAGTDELAWTAEYEANVAEHVEVISSVAKTPSRSLFHDPYAVTEEALDEWQDAWWDYIDESAPTQEVP